MPLPDTIPCSNCVEFVHVATIAALLRFPDDYVGETCPRCGLRVARAALLAPVNTPTETPPCSPC